VTASEQLRPDVLAEREVYFEQFKDVPLADIVVIDESYATTKFTRLYGRATRGLRLVGRVPHGHWKLLTIIAAMTIDGVLTAASIDASTDTDVFGLFVRDALIPRLRPGQVVVMDNLAAHKVGWIKQAIEKAGCRVVFLPPYSPDYSPIEPMWSKVKQHLRTLGARTIDALGQAIESAFKRVTSADCHGFFRHCGYAMETVKML